MLLFALLASLPVDPLAPGAPAVLRGHTDAVTALAFSPDGGTLASASRDTSIRLWSLESGAELSAMAGDKAATNAIAFSPDGATLATGTVELQVRLLDLATGATKRVIAFPDAVMDLAFSPGGTVLAVSGPSGLTTVFTVADGKARPFNLRGRSAKFSGDGKTLALGLPGGGIVLVDPANGKTKKSIATPSHAPMITFSADGTMLATWSGNDRAIHLWSAVTGKSLGELSLPAVKDPFENAPPTTLSALALSASGACVVSVSADLRLRVWDVAKKALRVSYPLQREGAVALTPDGSLVAVADGAQIKIWPTSKR